MSLSDYIVETPGTCGGKPRIAGTRIRVQDVAFLSEPGGMSPDEIARGFGLTLPQVHAALAYYFEHIETIQQQLREQEQFVEQFKREYPSLLEAKLKQIRSAG